MREIILNTEDLTVGYRGVPVLRDVSIQIRRGEILTLIGPNGAGKSTVLKTMIGQLAPICGVVCLRGRDLARMAEGELARSLSVVMTQRPRPELMTCGEVVAMGRHPYTGLLGLLTPRDWAIVEESMDLVGARDLFYTDFSQLSDGQRQRVLLARAVCQEPEVIVLDEPTSHLDVRYQLELLATLKTLARERGLAVLLSLHELDLAQKISDRVLCVHQGRVQRAGPPEEIFSGDYIARLYGVTRGSYLPQLGCLELEAVPGPPEVFVIGGGGAGIPVYRRLQRQGIPFAAGILWENDLDLPVARALAAELVCQRAFTPADEALVQQALELLDRCRQVLCCSDEFGPWNQCNAQLAARAPEKTCFLGKPPAGL